MGFACNDIRDDYLNEWLGKLNFSITNKRDTPTFVRGSSESLLDIPLQSGVTCKAYADHLTVMIEPQNDVLIQKRTNGEPGYAEII